MDRCLFTLFLFGLSKRELFLSQADSFVCVGRTKRAPKPISLTSNIQVESHRKKKKKTLVRGGVANEKNTLLY